jgi:xanthine dehydrogenase YagR molybdenum-binding subunit
MADYNWPQADKRSLIGKRISRLDGPAKASGAARYTHDINRPKMLFGKVLRCPHAHAKLTKLDLSPAESMPGVRAVLAIQKVGAEIQWALDEVAAVAAETEEQAADAVHAIVAEYEVLPASVVDDDLAKATGDPQEKTNGKDPDAALAAAEVRIEGEYGLPSVAHCCLEAHGTVWEWRDEQNVTVWVSTQGVSLVPADAAEGLGIPASNIRAVTEYVGGGFGSKFGLDRWDLAAGNLAKQAKAPVKLMLERAEEIAVAGDRPSAYAKVKLGASKDGTIQAWVSESWGSGGLGGSGSPPLPYVFRIGEMRQRHRSVTTNTASSRAWRAPNHPQACFITMSALEDLAAALAMDPLDFFLKNIELTGGFAKAYREELAIGAELMDWKKKWHPRGTGSGVKRRGLGLSLHTWGGRGHNSSCAVTISPDGSVEVKLGSQDLGTGTRTVIGIVVAETLGLPLEAVKVSIGDSRYPTSGPSGGSTTVGGVSASSRRAAVHALNELFAKVAPELGAPPDQLEARAGRIQVAAAPDKGLSWKDAAARIGLTPLTATGENPGKPGEGKLNDSGVGGIQMAEVSVDVETGVVKLEKLVCAQDCGLVIDLKTAESQVYGGMIMGIGYALSEEKIYDPQTSRPLNPNMEMYKLAGIGDVGELVAHLMTGPGYDERGTIGLGEPPVISPGAAISNAVANAIGVRVPRLPITPDRVLAALEKGGKA